MNDLARIVAEVTEEITANAAEIERAAEAGHDCPPDWFGMAVATPDGGLFHGGYSHIRFPLQSISKVFALELALEACGDQVFKRVGREPSGDPFNSIVDLERNKGVPRNPFINAGALVVCDILVEHKGDDASARAVVEFVRREAGLSDVVLNDDVLESGRKGGDLNRAMMSFARHHGNLHCDIDEVMEAYVHQCAIEIDAKSLAKAGLFLTRTARSGDPEDDKRAKRTRRLLSLMTTSGQYDGSGDFAYRVGLPAKSGVGGGILAIVPQVASIAVWSNNLDRQGNSILGVRALELLADKADWSVFG
ncbi:glutaminase A [Sphingomonas hankookensis]|uniref:Glutaminase n=1 Tax=Sphingomonas hengshuiensis TaxID=1609977 RepID=A0A2W5AU14_9SPHN|nr:MAG: glutaminase A [Sphingomonas hengshuiensis]